MKRQNLITVLNKNNNHSTLLSGLVASWKMSDLTGIDDLGFSNLTRNGSGTTLSSGKIFPNSVVFPNTGTNNFFSALSSSLLTSSSTGFTIACWLKINSDLAGNQTVISKWGSEYLFYISDGTPAMQFLSQNSSSASEFSQFANFNVGQWDLYIFGYDPAGTSNKFFCINNAILTKRSVSNIKISTNTFRIGESGSLTGFSINAVAKWNRVLTTQEISLLWNGGMGLGYPFDYSQNIIFDGNSLTFGGGLGTSYPSQTITSLSGKFNYYNAGHAGAGIETLISEAATKVDTRLVSGKKNILIFEGGINNLYYVGSTQDQNYVYGYTQTYVAARIAAGWNKVFVSTMTPVNPAISDVNYETKRLALNVLLRGDFAGGDGVVDPGGDAIIGNVANTTNPTYFSDGLHMTAAGYAIWAGLAKTSLLGA